MIGNNDNMQEFQGLFADFGEVFSLTVNVPPAENGSIEKSYANSGPKIPVILLTFS